jgi:hypothetical protein
MNTGITRGTRLGSIVFLIGTLSSTAPTVGQSSTDMVLDWNATTLKTTAAAPFNPPVESRNVAIVHAAMFDAVNSIVGEFQPYAVQIITPAAASPDAAAAAAAHFALVRLYPAQQATLDAAYADSLAVIADGQAKADGIAVGETVAAQILASRASDGAAEAIVTPYAPPAGPGFWTPTPPAFRSALDPGWGSVRPFLLENGAQFRPGPPPALDDLRYTRDFEEIKDIGSATSVTRTQAQTDLARFWIATAPQNWNPAARQAAIAQGRTLSENARAFALLNMAGADTFIASWGAKFLYNQWRPVTAIRAADTDGNAETMADPSWTPLLVTPPFPDYIAGHTTFAGAAEKVLGCAFGHHPGVTMTLTSATAPGVMPIYVTFADIANDVVDARVWGGIHWRTSSARGQRVGQRIGVYAVHHFLRRLDGIGDCTDAESEHE